MEKRTAKTANMILNAMENNLFDMLESPSPRLQWMEKHGITTAPRIWDAYEGNTRWAAFHYLKNPAYGDSEDEAITQLALKLGIKLHNEEGQP